MSECSRPWKNCVCGIEVIRYQTGAVSLIGALLIPVQDSLSAIGFNWEPMTPQTVSCILKLHIETDSVLLPLICFDQTHCEIRYGLAFPRLHKNGEIPAACMEEIQPSVVRIQLAEREYPLTLPWYPFHRAQ